MQGDLRPLGRAPLQHFMFGMIAGVVQNQMPATVRIPRPQCAQKVAKLQIGVLSVALTKDLASADVKGGHQVDHAVTDILELPALDLARSQRQGRGQPLQGLNPGFLVHTQQPTVPRRVQVQVHNLFHLPLKLRISAGQPVAKPMWLQHHLRQDPLDRGRAHRDEFAAAGYQPGQVAHAVVREPAEVPLPLRLTGHADHEVTGLRGKKPAGVPTGVNLPGQEAEPATDTGQTACATSVPSCAPWPTPPRLPDYSGPHQPAGSQPPAGPPAVAFYQPGAKPRSPAALQRSTLSHTVDVTWPSPSARDGQHFTANELMRRGTSCAHPT